MELGSIKPDLASVETEQNNSIKNQFEKINPTSILKEAKDQATEIINHPFGGNIYIDKNTGCLYILDTKDIETAKNVWKWSLGGLGFSSNGINGPFDIALTSDGKIVADFVKTGSLSTSVIDGYEQLLLQVNSSKDKLDDMYYNFNTDALKISKKADPNSCEVNNSGLKLYSYDNLKMISNQNGTGVQKLIVVGDAQIGYLKFIKEKDDNGNECTDIHHLVSNIQTLEDLEV